ncbi:hypothetical protein OQA88_11818 [Cercophora sp. LCS_1]
MILPREVLMRAATVGSEFGTTPDTKPQVRLNAVGIWWICFGAVWTAALAAGMSYLYRKRHTPMLRMRGLPLTFAGLILLHLYWATVQVGYAVGPLAPEVAEFWIMSIWYPFGIALFQAGNSQFLHIAKAQSRFARSSSQVTAKWMKPTQKGGIFARLRRMEYSQRMFLFVTIGMACQLFVVVLIFMISRKFHPSFGIPGTEVYGSTPMEIAMQQGRGWEWWPSLFWQFLWAWVIAPIILWRSRGIRDTHGWQLQTMACCIAGLPAAPMWLIALYVPAMHPVNMYFIPPQWIALSIFVMEIFTVFVPIIHLRRHQSLRQETLDSIASWESKKSVSSSTPTLPVSPTSATSDSNPWKAKKLASFDASSDFTQLPGESVLTMAALEHVLSKNPEPLLQFSATRDFSGENISFLTAVSQWKAQLPPAFIRNRHNCSPEITRQQYTTALAIYTTFISPLTAEFPINIAWSDLRKLEGVFKHAASSVPAATCGATPFADTIPSTLPSRAGSEVGIVRGEDKSMETLVLEEKSWGGDIPQTFDASVFDAAEASIKYLVLTNTWPKYVRERRSSEGSTRTYETGSSQGSFKRLMGFLKPLVG